MVLCLFLLVQLKKKNEKSIFFIVTNLHEEVRKLSGKDGWITVNEFIKFSQPTDLCKSDFTPFTGYTWDKDGKQVKSSTSSSTNTKHEAKKKTVSNCCFVRKIKIFKIIEFKL